MRKKDMSKLRIQRGSLRGRLIHFVETPDLRPTLSRVRESVFNMIDDFSSSHGFLDLCAGTGIMAFEAVSNGFDPVHAIEIDHDAITTMQRNQTDLELSFPIHRAYAEKVNQVDLPEQPWLIYADPPYREGRFHIKVMERLTQMPPIQPESIYIAEQETSWHQDVPEGWELWKEKRYGRVYLYFFQRV